MRKALNTALAAAFVTAALTACSDDSSEPTTTLDIAGTWTITENVDGTDCGDGTYTDTYDLSVSQNGSSITVGIGGLTFSGTLNGSNLTWSGSFPEDGGTTSVNITATVASSGDSLSGSSTWGWSDGVESCAGTSTFTGVKG
jgi:hypothetical protein